MRGSSSVKYQLMDTTTESVLAKGLVERIGFDDAKFTHVPGDGPKQVKTLPVKNHDIAMKHVLASLVGEGGVLASLAEIFRARIVDVARDSVIVEVTGDEQKVDGLVELLRPRGIVEMVRTGKVAMVRGSVGETRPGAEAAPAA